MEKGQGAANQEPNTLPLPSFSLEIILSFQKHVIFYPRLGEENEDEDKERKPFDVLALRGASLDIRFLSSSASSSPSRRGWRAY